MPPKKAAAKKRAAPKRPASRTSRAERLQRQKVRRSLRRRFIVAGIALAALAAVILLTRADDDAAIIDEIEAGGACSYDTVTGEDPPSGGDVADIGPAEPGFYTTDDDDVPSDVALTRSMRQGFVVLWYDPDTSPDELHGVSDGFGRDLIVVPKPGLPTPVAVTAWERRLMCRSFDEAAVAHFTEAFRDRGPEKGFL